MLSFLRKILGKKKKPKSVYFYRDCVWIEPRNNDFGLRILDCQAVANSYIATTTDESVAHKFSESRLSDGQEYLDRQPDNPIEISCDLKYPYNSQHEDGPLFKATCMDEKWDCYLYNDILYMVNSWLGDLIYTAHCSFEKDIVAVQKIFSVRDYIGDDVEFAIKQLDFLIKSHVSNTVVPHPIPDTIENDKRDIALYSFSTYGNRGLFASYENTLSTMGNQNFAR